MKKFVLLVFIVLSQLSLQAQNIMLNGDFENHDGTMETLMYWGSSYYANLMIFGNDSEVRLTDHDDDVAGVGDGHILQYTPMYEGADYTFSFTINAPALPISAQEHSELTVTALNFNDPPSELIINIPLEDYAGAGPTVITEEFTANRDYTFIYIDIDGFDYNDSDNDIGFSTYSVDVDDVSLVSDDAPNFHFETAAGNEVTGFCDSEDVFMNAEASLSVEHYYIDSWRRAIADGPDAEFKWAGTLGWETDNEIGTLNLSELFAEANAAFELGYEYQIKLAIHNEYSGWWPMTHEFFYVESVVVDYHFEDGSGVESDLFCNGESVVLNANETLFEEEYQLKIYEKNLSTNSGFQERLTTPWTDGNIGSVNLTELYAADVGAFLNNHEYKVRLIAGNKCHSVEYLEKTFIYSLPPVPNLKLIDSDQNITTQFCIAEEVILDGSASLYESRYRISIYERPMNSNANFAWRGITSWIQGEIGQVVLDDIYEDFGYQFLGDHEYRVRLMVGNDCDGWVFKQKTFQMYEECCFAPESLDCSSSSGSSYLNWTPVPMATSYVVEMVYNNCCLSTLPQFSTEEMAKKETSLQIPFTFYDCFSWRVRVECGNNIYYSEWSCFTRGMECASAEFQDDDPRFRIELADDFKIYPNPASDYINISITGDLDAGEIFMVDAAGKMVLKTSSDVSQIDTQSFDAGIYFLLVKSGKNILHRERVVIVK